MSINIPDDDTSLIKLKEAKELAMKVKTVGKDIFQMDRSFDVMEKAAENEGSAAPIPNQKKYFFVVNGLHSQPFQESDLPKLISEGLVKQDTLAWTEGLKDWVQAIEIDQIKILFNQTPPPIPK